MIELKSLTSSDPEQFIKDNQEAFNYGALEEFGRRDDHFEIEKPGEIKVICRRESVHKPETGAGTPDITGFWTKCGQDGTMQKICSYIPERPRLAGLLGICFSLETDGDMFPYGIGVEYNGAPAEPGLEVITLPEYTYAVFPFKGKMPDTFIETYRKIVSEFFPSSVRYEYAGGVEIEVYPSDKTDDPNYSGEIWIAVNEK